MVGGGRDKTKNLNLVDVAELKKFLQKYINA
jgi:hypothetical protein